MAKAAKKTPEGTETFQIRPLEMQTMTFRLLGTTPLIMNKQSEKAVGNCCCRPGRPTRPRERKY